MATARSIASPSARPAQLIRYQLSEPSWLSGDVVAAPLDQRMSPGSHGECGPAILPHEQRGIHDIRLGLCEGITDPGLRRNGRSGARLRGQATGSSP
jgi:hypothetical protein